MGGVALLYRLVSVVCEPNKSNVLWVVMGCRCFHKHVFSLQTLYINFEINPTVQTAQQRIR